MAEALPGTPPGPIVRTTVSLIFNALPITERTGTSLGTVVQANDVPAGTLDGPWGDIGGHAGTAEA